VVRDSIHKPILIWFAQVLIWSSLLISGFYYSYKNELNIYIEDRLTVKSATIYTSKQIISKIIQIVRADVYGMAHDERFYKLSSNPTTDELNSISREFSLLSETKGTYDQIRYINSRGMEVVRINNNNGKAVRVLDINLQNKASRYYFKNTINLNKGDIYLSPFDLNKEQGQIEQPIKPMIRVATPVFDQLNRKRGIVIINYLGSDLLNSFKESSSFVNNHPMLLNSDGYWLYNINPELEWGFMYEKDTRFQNAYPSVWAELNKKDKGQIQTGQGIFTYDTIYITTDERISDTGTSSSINVSDKNNTVQSLHWKIIFHIPMSVIDQATSKIFKKYLTLFIPIFIVLILIHSIFSYLLSQYQQKEFIYNRILERSLNEIYVFDSKTLLFENVNQGALQNIGYSLYELKLMTPVDIKPEFVLEDFNKLTEPLHRGTKEIVTFETIHQRKDGSTYPVEVHLQLMGGSLELYVAFVLDISVRKKAEEQLKQYAGMVSCSEDMMALVDKKHHFITANQAYYKKRGLTAEQIIGKHMLDIVGEEYYNSQAKPRLDEILTGKTINFEAEITLSPTDKRTFSIVYSPYIDAEGSIKGTIISGHDITEHEILKASRVESIGILAGGIAHDFNNILTSLFGNIQLAQMKLDTDHAAYKYIQTAYNAMNQAKSLTGQLLTFAKGGQPLLEIEDIKSVISDSAILNLSGSNVKYRLKIADDLWQIRADKGQLSQVFGNIIINANQAMEGGGKIDIIAENITNIDEEMFPGLSGNYIMISICDEGSGISKDNINNIFDPYFSTKSTGSGIGLASVYSVIKKHQGEITVDSETGIGTTFTIYLPATPMENNETKKDTDKVQTENTKIAISANILLMDDEEAIRELCEELLASIGCTVQSVEDGKEALELYKEAKASGKPFDISIMDLTIPNGMGGVKTMEALLAFDADAKAIVSSGYSSDDAMANYKKYGFSARLVKPFQLEDLKQTISTLMSG